MKAHSGKLGVRSTMNGLEITVLLDVSSNAFEIEWPPKSGRLRAFPEVDRASTGKSPD